MKTQITQADLSLRWAHSHFAGFVMLRLNYENLQKGHFWEVSSSITTLKIDKLEPRVDSERANFCRSVLLEGLK